MLLLLRSGMDRRYRWKKIWTLLEMEDDSDTVAGGRPGRCWKRIRMLKLDGIWKGTRTRLLEGEGVVIGMIYVRCLGPVDAVIENFGGRIGSLYGGRYGGHWKQIRTLLLLYLQMQTLLLDVTGRRSGRYGRCCICSYGHCCWMEIGRDGSESGCWRRMKLLDGDWKNIRMLLFMYP